MPSAAVLLVFGRGVVPAGAAASHDDGRAVARELHADGRSVARQLREDGRMGGPASRDDGPGWELTASSLDRVAAAVRYVAVHAPLLPVRPRVIFTGGWAEASEGAAPPPAGAREGDLMLRTAAGTGLNDLADLYAETRSRSTLENLLHTVDDGLLAGQTFGPAYPLGLVSHAWHLPRVRFLVGKVLGLRGPALVDIPATGDEVRDDRRLLLAARLNLLGARRGATLLRRERRMVALSRLARRIRQAGSARRR